MTALLPPLYAAWIAELLPGAIPEERRATCDRCAMCAGADGAAPVSAYAFEPDIKCCVYLPVLPGFLVGRALRDGVATVADRVRSGVAVTPLGVGRPASYDLRYRNAVNAVGRSRSLRCPHFVVADGTCGVWDHRDAMCATWFCRHLRGRVGLVFWLAVRDLLAAVEDELARWSAVQVGADPEAIAALMPRRHGPPPPQPDGAAVDGRVDPASHAALWGEWAGREVAFFEACARCVEGLSWSEVVAICGPGVGILATAAVRAYERLIDRGVPERVHLGGFTVVARSPAAVRVVTHSSLDAIDVPVALFGVLPLFDGRPLDAILEQVEATWNMKIDADYLQELVDWGVLVGAP